MMKVISRKLFQRNYIMEVPKKLMSKRKQLHWYLTGFADAEGCFSVAIKKQKNTRFGWVIDPLFQVTQHKEGVDILNLFQKTLNCGRVIKKPGSDEQYVFLVDNRRQLSEKIILFFEKYPLIVKNKDFQYFKEIISNLEAGKHKEISGLERLIKKAYKMNLEGKQRRKLEQILSELKK